MSIKKLIVVGVALTAAIGAASVYAGGPEVIPCPVPPPFVPYVYIGGAVGGAFSDWNSYIWNGATEHADTSGFTYGGKLGYQATYHYGIEVGGYVLPDSSQTFDVGGLFFDENEEVSGKVESWILYFAATLRAPILGNEAWHVNAKLGGVYRNLGHSGTLYSFTKFSEADSDSDSDNNTIGGDVGTGHYWTVLAGAGLDYDFSTYYNFPVSVGVEYLLIPGSTNAWFGHNGVAPDGAPTAHIGVASVVVHFAV